MSNKNINYQFKILYAIGIYLIVANHCMGGISLFGEIFPAYSFHVALFPFCSGYFYNENNEDNVFGYVIKKIKKLIIPLYLYNFLYCFIAQLLSLKNFNMGIEITLYKLFLWPIYNGHQFTYNLATWFIAPLFMIEVFNIIFRKIFNVSNSKTKEYIYLVFSFLLGVLGIYLSSKGLNQRWYLALDRFLHFLPFYCIGFFYKKFLEEKDTLNNTLYFSIVLFLQLIVTFINNGPVVYEQARSRFNEFNIMPYIVALLAISFYLRLSRILSPIIGKSRVINIVADNTYSIMANHLMGFMIVKAVFAFLNKNFNLFADFNWVEYHRFIFYIYLPRNIALFKLVYIVFAIIFSILIQMLINKINKIIKGNNVDKKKLFIKYLIIYIIIALITLIPAKLIEKHVSSIGGPKVDAQY